MTKGKVLDHVVSQIRQRGLDVQRGSYLKDFLFDAVVSRGKKRSALEVLSFATAAQVWSGVEHDAGHFLFALERVDVPGMAVIQPPTDESHQNAATAFERVSRWFRTAKVPIVAPDVVGDELAGIGRLF
jgi:hypothetical protein